MKKVAFFKIGALGDVLMTTPLVRQVRKALPDADIDYLVGKSCAGILEGNRHLTKVVSFDEGILYRRQIQNVSSVVRMLRGYDAIFVLDKHWIFALIARLAGSPLRVGFARRPIDALFLTRKIPYGTVRHEIAYYLALGQAAGLPIDPGDVGVDLPPAVGHPLPRPYTVVINGGGANANEQSTVRRMPDVLFSELVRACLGNGSVVFLGAKGESKYYDMFAVAGTTNLCGRTSLREAWDVLENAQAVYSTDNGLMHMAGTLNPNLTAIFGPTHPARKCPPGARWAWTDRDVYDERYELYGELPRRTFFQKMRLDDILEAVRQPAS